MNKNIQLFYQEAQRLHLPVQYHAEINLLEIRLGKTPYYFMETTTPLNEGASIFAATNKYTSNAILEKFGFPVPKANAFTKEMLFTTPLAELIDSLHFPLVAKSLRTTHQSSKVFCKIQSIDDLSTCLNDLFAHVQGVKVEEFHRNLNAYRVLILNNNVIGVLERLAPYIIGDGHHSIAQLIDLKNEQRKQLNDLLELNSMSYGFNEEQCLQEQELTMQSIPEKGQKIWLSYTANIAAGGEFISQGTTLHPQNAQRLLQAVNTLGLTYGGVDLLCADINQPFATGDWVLLGINPIPDISLHELAPWGKPTPIAKKILWHLIKRHPLAYLSHRYSPY